MVQLVAGSASLYFLLPRISEENDTGSDTLSPRNFVGNEGRKHTIHPPIKYIFLVRLGQAPMVVCNANLTWGVTHWSVSPHPTSIFVGSV